MNIQIYGKAKCFDTKKAERYFKERRIKYQFIDVIKYGMSRGELNSVKNAVGLDAMVNTETRITRCISISLRTTRSLRSSMRFHIL